MKLLRLSSLIVIFLAASQSLLAQETRSIGDRNFVRSDSSWTQIDPGGQEYAVNPEKISVKFSTGGDQVAQDILHSSLGTTELSRAATGWADIQLAPGQDVFEAIDAYMASGLVVMAEPNTLGRYEVVPNDPRYSSQWHLPVMNLEMTWETTTGSPSVIVAILDSGTEFTHEDLGTGADAYQNIWLNPGEDAWSDPNDPSSGNGVDDDSNGFVDDWKGVDYVNMDNDPSSSNSHGTFVAGTVAAKMNNSTGVASVAGGWNNQGTSLMLEGVGEIAPDGSILDDAILYAIDKQAHVVQLSLSVGQSTAIDDAIQMAIDNNIVVVCAAGNNGPAVSYPARNPNVIAVASTNQVDQRSPFSNQGPETEVAAPGSSIFTTTSGNNYASNSGTSFAAPNLSGVISLMLSVNPGLDVATIRQILKDTAVKVGGYDYNHDSERPGHSLELGYGRVDALAAVNAAQDLAVLDYKSGFEDLEK